MDQKCWVVCYDVADPRRLRRVAALMEQYGTRVQKSVFECWLTERALAEMRDAVLRQLKPHADSFRCYTLCQDCLALSASCGDTDLIRPEKYVIV